MQLSAFVLCLVASQVFVFSSATSSPIQSSEISNYLEKWGWLVRFLDAFMFPNNTIEAATVNSTLFSENVQGRVDLTSTFDGRELNTEVRRPNFSFLMSVYLWIVLHNCEKFNPWTLQYPWNSHQLYSDRIHSDGKSSRSFIRFL
jgi:hypothetical protein